MPDIAKRRRFLLFLVKPSHYDDEGYVIQWWKSALPSNSLACLFGIAQRCMEDQVLGEDVDIEIFPVDETNTRVRPERIARQIQDNGGFGMVGFVGVQSNQFPRVMDCARPLRAAGVQVCIGGFHVSGCLSMLPETPDSLKEALDLGISLYAGEAEGRFDEVLRDAAAGVKRVFIGLENIDPDNLSAAKKKQNHISDYRELLLEWRKHRVITYCGYIIGFPNDTPESLVKRIQIIQRELPLDILEFSILTPLPGSEDHAKAVAKGVDIDSDLNKFDLEHVTTDHPRMSREEWQESYRLAWRTYYTPEHIKTVIRRAVAGGPRPDTVAYLLTWFWASFHFYNIYPLETGIIRRRYRRDRRPGMPLENPILFYARNWGGQVITYGRILAMFAKIHLWTRKLERDPNAKNYTDEALRAHDDYDHQEMYQLTEATRQAGAKAKHIEERKHAHAPLTAAVEARAEPAE